MSQGQAQAPVPIVTLWATYGSRLEEVALKLAEELNIPFRKGAFTSQDLKDAADRAAHDRGADGWYIVQAIPARGRRFTWRNIFQGVERSLDETRESLVRDVREQAREGGVFMGRNATVILGSYPNALHVKLDGPLEERIKRIMKERGVDERQAREDQRFEDDVRAQMSISLFDWDPRSEEGYDLTVQTTHLDTDTIVAIIAGAARAKYEKNYGVKYPA
ncbi:MAG TPA: cytidylate kinase-like family protein [Actinomycetaceae bacterium]|nr:cytidylate kinase-like family protein [Actinomycetaceae bacterium]